MKNLISNRSGFSLVEVMISLIIISIATYGYLEIRERVSKREQKYTSDLNVMKLMLSLKEQVMSDDEFIIPLENKDDNYWGSDKTSAVRCFDRQGALRPERVKSGENWIGWLVELENLPSDAKERELPEAEKNFYETNNDQRIKALTTGICTYFLVFYKTGLMVSGQRAPVSQYHMKLSYFRGNSPDAPLKTYVFRPIKTQSFYY